MSTIPVIVPSTMAFGQGRVLLSRVQLFKKYEDAQLQGEVYLGDAAAFLRSLDSESASIVFLDPPFNLGKRYNKENIHQDLLPEVQYERWMRRIIRESVRILAPGGALFLYHLPKWALRFGPYLADRLDFRHWIAVSMKNGFARGEKLYPAHYSLLYFTKGDPAVFNRPRLPAAVCRHCGKLVKDYGGYKQIIDEKGINLSDVWDDLSPVRHSKSKKREQNQLPLALTDRIVAISGLSQSLLVDPFAGSGSAIISAAAAGMCFKACDIVSENCSLIVGQLQENFGDVCCGESHEA